MTWICLADMLEPFVKRTIRGETTMITEYAVDARYPGVDIDEDEAAQAVKYAEHIQRRAEAIPPSDGLI